MNFTEIRGVTTPITYIEIGCEYGNQRLKRTLLSKPITLILGDRLRIYKDGAYKAIHKKGKLCPE